MLNGYNPFYETNAYQITYKEAVDSSIFTEALEKASMHETNSTDNHFIIGSVFHAESHVRKMNVINRPTQLQGWLLNEVKSQGEVQPSTCISTRFQHVNFILL